MRKRWEKKSDFSYIFFVDENEIGQMDIFQATNSNKVIFAIGGKEMELKRSGFWKSNLEITEGNGEVILRSYPEKWYANTWVVAYKNKDYKLIVRNNPLAEFVLLDGNQEISAYGLTSENREIRVRISSSDNSEYIFDFLLWYLFLPIANENMGNTYSFLNFMAS